MSSPSPLDPRHGGAARSDANNASGEPIRIASPPAAVPHPAPVLDVEVGGRLAASERSGISELTVPWREERPRRTRREMYVRRCARAMAAYVALSALNVSTIYLGADDPDSVLDAFVSGLFGSRDDPDADQRLFEFSRSLTVDKYDIDKYDPERLTPQDLAAYREELSRFLESYVDELSRREVELARLLNHMGDALPQDPIGEGDAGRRSMPQDPQDHAGNDRRAGASLGKEGTTDRLLQVDATAGMKRGGRDQHAASRLAGARAGSRRGRRASFRHAVRQPDTSMQFYRRNA